jgi:hypothetical protein
MNWGKFLDILDQSDLCDLQEALRIREIRKGGMMLNGDELSLIANGNPIGAINSVRNRLGLGLREAKGMIDAYRNKKQE